MVEAIGQHAGYRPIEDYGVIGNTRTVALVCRDGSIDWCCLPQLDSPSVFAALLDWRRGGRFQVRARGVDRGEQEYVEHTNVLETSFDADGGRLVVTDFMAIEGDLEGCGNIRPEPAIHRLLRAEGGPVHVELEWAPRPEYAQQPTSVHAHGSHGYVAHSGETSVALSGHLPEGSIEADVGGQLVRAHFVLRPGERRVFISSWGPEPSTRSLERAQKDLGATVALWQAWVHKDAATGDRSWAGAQNELVIRSELTLKLLTQTTSGALAAAGTASLPETLGGVRNWDYRFTWIRDAALSAQALFALGHQAEALAFIRWAERAARLEGERTWGLRLVYGLHGETELGERELSHLEGYRGSSPVRIGNAAGEQMQLDIYGELISAAYEVVRMGTELADETRAFLPGVADQACAAHHEPDFGIWEARNGPHHFVYSKAMVWMALDRAVRLHRRGVIQGDVGRWEKTNTKLREEILSRGYDTELGAFKRTYDSSELDASNLLLPFLELLPFDDPRTQGTIDRTLERLTESDLVYRYVSEDGLPGKEGAFVLCTFWLVDALALSNRLDEAHRIYEGVVGRANHLGLFAEQIDPRSGAFLGNFPQAFSHIGLIGSTLYLAHQEGRETPVSAPIGSQAHRDREI